MYTKQQRIIAGLTCALMVCFFMLSALFLVHVAEHDCTGADCPVCASVQEVRENLKKLGGTAGFSCVLLLFALGFVAILCLGTATPQDQSREDLLTQKVRFNT